MEYILSNNYYLSLICILPNSQKNSYEAGTIILIFQGRKLKLTGSRIQLSHLGSKWQS